MLLTYEFIDFFFLRIQRFIAFLTFCQRFFFLSKMGPWPTLWAMGPQIEDAWAMGPTIVAIGPTGTTIGTTSPMSTANGATSPMGTTTGVKGPLTLVCNLQSFFFALKDYNTLLRGFH